MITAQAADFQAMLAYARIVAETNRNIWMNCIHTSGKRTKDRPKDLARKAAQSGGRIKTMAIEKMHVCEMCQTKVSNPSRFVGWIIVDLRSAIFYTENTLYPSMPSYKQHSKKVLDFCSFGCMVSYFEKYAR